MLIGRIKEANKLKSFNRKNPVKIKAKIVLRNTLMINLVRDQLKIKVPRKSSYSEHMTKNNLAFKFLKSLKKANFLSYI